MSTATTVADLISTARKYAADRTADAEDEKRIMSAFLAGVEEGAAILMGEVGMRLVLQQAALKS